MGCHMFSESYDLRTFTLGSIIYGTWILQHGTSDGDNRVHLRYVAGLNSPPIPSLEVLRVCTRAKTDSLFHRQPRCCKLEQYKPKVNGMSILLLKTFPYIVQQHSREIFTLLKLQKKTRWLLGWLFFLYLGRTRLKEKCSYLFAQSGEDSSLRILQWVISAINFGQI